MEECVALDQHVCCRLNETASLMMDGLNNCTSHTPLVVLTQTSMGCQLFVAKYISLADLPLLLGQEKHGVSDSEIMRGDAKFC